VAEIVARVMEGGLTGLYACAHPTTYRMSELVAAIGRALGKTPRVVRQRDKPDLRDIEVPQDATLYRQIGFQPRVDFADCVRRLASEL
jgi:nucleoside-diphosphate-sugar epimerase